MRTFGDGPGVVPSDREPISIRPKRSEDGNACSLDAAFQFPSDLLGIVPVGKLAIVGKDKTAAEAMNGGIVDLSTPFKPGISTAEAGRLLFLGSGWSR